VIRRAVYDEEDDEMEDRKEDGKSWEATQTT